MKISSRLLLTLLPTVVGIMALYATWAVRQREALSLQQNEAEARVFSTAVSIAFAHAFRDLQFQDVQDILASIDDEPGIYGVVFYDLDGVPTLTSAGLEAVDFAPPETVSAVLEADSVVILDRMVDDERAQSVLRSVRDREGAVIGILEVAQPLSFVEGERTQTTRRFILNTATLLMALAILLVILVRRYVGRPLEDFAKAIHDLGEGLPRSLEPGLGRGELKGAVTGFNQMVDRLALARTELERESEERLALQEQFREKEHLAALGTLAAGVAHQIATPLSVIGGRAEGLLRRADHSPADARSLQIIQEQSQRITRIVRNLLHFARRPEPEIRATDVVAAVERALELFVAEFDEVGIRLERDLPRSAFVKADPELLEEVLVTLLDNSVRALREPGATLTLSVSVTVLASSTTIEIRDGGPGIPPEVLHRIFEPFFTTRSGGTGLGLAVSHGIIKQLGGRLDVENALATDGEAGAISRIVLPSATPAPTLDPKGSKD